MVSNILRAKFRLGLFDNPYTEINNERTGKLDEHLEAAKSAAVQSCVLLENKNSILPLSNDKLSSIAIVGPLADDGYEQLGTWIFDGDSGLSQTPLHAIKSLVGDTVKINYCRAMETTRSKSREGFGTAVETAKNSDAVILFLGEESILSGEAHCRTDISLPGNQEDLIEEISSSGKPVILVIMAGRPLQLDKLIDKVDAILYAWHPGSMAGPAIADLLFGIESPSGKLPVTFPRVVGQIPIYYNHKNTGRPASEQSVVSIDDIKPRAPQHSCGDTSFYLDTDNSPLYPFGYGLSYSKFSYANLTLSHDRIEMNGSIEISVELTNTGKYEAEEVAQLYIRDLVGSVTRPVKELKGFKKLRLKPGESKSVTFKLTADDLAFYDRRNKRITEPGKFHLWVGGSSATDLKAEFEILE
jgi:beta-glucosidase